MPDFQETVSTAGHEPLHVNSLTVQMKLAEVKRQKENVSGELKVALEAISSLKETREHLELQVKSNREDWEAEKCEKEQARRERDAALREREAALREREVALRERDAALRERDTAIRERDAAAWERVVRERDVAAWERAVRVRDATQLRARQMEEVIRINQPQDYSRGRYLIRGIENGQSLCTDGADARGGKSLSQNNLEAEQFKSGPNLEEICVRQDESNALVWHGNEKELQVFPKTADSSQEMQSIIDLCGDFDADLGTDSDPTKIQNVLSAEACNSIGTYSPNIKFNASFCSNRDSELGYNILEPTVVSLSADFNDGLASITSFSRSKSKFGDVTSHSNSSTRHCAISAVPTKSDRVPNVAKSAEPVNVVAGSTPVSNGKWPVSSSIRNSGVELCTRGKSNNAGYVSAGSVSLSERDAGTNSADTGSVESRKQSAETRTLYPREKEFSQRTSSEINDSVNHKRKVPLTNGGKQSQKPSSYDYFDGVHTLTRENIICMGCGDVFSQDLHVEFLDHFEKCQKS